MRHVLFISIIFISLLLLMACTQKKAEIVDDIVAAAPDKAELVLQNDYIGVHEFSLQPGEALPLHKGGPRAIYALSDYKIKWTEGDQVSEKTWQKGDVHWHDAVNHAVENIGDTEARYITVTRTSNALPETQDYDIAQDASQMDSTHANNIFENEQVRVIEVQLPVGEVQPMHQGINRLIYSLTPYQIEYTSDQMDTKEMQMEEGDAHWHTADQHSVKNIGETEAHYLIFEFKK